jgi:hypothetical protein
MVMSGGMTFIPSFIVTSQLCYKEASECCAIIRCYAVGMRSCMKRERFGWLHCGFCCACPRGRIELPAQFGSVCWVGSLELLYLGSCPVPYCFASDHSPLCSQLQRQHIHKIKLTAELTMSAGRRGDKLGICLPTT